MMLYWHEQPDILWANTTKYLEFARSVKFHWIAYIKELKRWITNSENCTIDEKKHIAPFFENLF